MAMDLRPKEHMIKNSIDRSKERETRNEEIRNLPHDQKVALAMEMGFPHVPLKENKKEVKKAS